MSEPDDFIQDISKELGLFYTTGFQEDYNARKEGTFADDEFARQADMVLEERLRLFEYAADNYDDGVLFFYFSSSDLQSHFFWWNSDDPHPIREPAEAQKWNGHIRRLYHRLDEVVGQIIDKYGGQATIIVMSDHGFANFGMQFNLNTWLREMGYLGPPDCTNLATDVDWSLTTAYGLGLNGLYLNLKGRERHGTIEPGSALHETLLTQIPIQLMSLVDNDGNQIIREVHRADKIYHGEATKFAPDLIVGYKAGYRVSWDSTAGVITDEIALPNDMSWSADHCADALEVPGVLVCNRELTRSGPPPDGPSLMDIAPSILAEFGIEAPSTMDGKSIFKS
jgi:predicted AlkP superfamily phosphohydrolase/phosphomutase